MPDERARDEQLDGILAEYMRRLDAGEAADREALIREHPDLADELRAHFEAADQVDRMAGPRAAETVRLADPTEPPPLLGVIRYFGDYELIEEIGRGGMGIIYRARQVSLNRIVAVKMILAGQLASEADLRRFHTEAEAAAQLQHPNIVAIHEIGEHEGQHYFSMDFIEGKSLAGMVREQPLPAKQAARYVETMAEAIHYAHEQGTLHRDLKPSNVVIDHNDEPRITDFGLAKLTADERGLTMSGAVLGTPSYMSPEQAAGKSREVSPRSDVYSLGALLYELLTGRPPFRAETPLQTLRQAIERDPVPPRQLNSTVPKDLESIVLKCLEKSPGRRYASARELGADLGRYRAGKPVRAKPTRAWRRCIKWARRRPAVAALSAAVVVVTFLGLGLVTWQWRRAESALDASDAALYASRIGLAHNEWAQKNLVRGEEILDECRPELRHWEWHYVKRLCHPHRLRIIAPDERAVDVAFSPDSQRVATASGKTMRFWDAGTGEQLFALEHNQPVQCLAFSPDGRLLATASGGEEGEVAIWDLAKRTKIRTRKIPKVPRGRSAIERPCYWFLSVAFSPDGKRVASPRDLRTFDIWDPLTGADIATVTGFGRAAFSPDGRHFVSHAGPYSLETGQASITGLPESDFRVNVLGDGGSLEWLVPPEDRQVSPDGKFLEVRDGTGRLFDATGKQIAALALPRDHIRCRDMDFSPDGGRVVLLAPDARVFDTATGQEIHTHGTSVLASPLRMAGSSGVYAAAFSSDGLRLATIGHYRPLDRSRREFVGKESTELHIWDGQLLRDAVTYERNHLPVTRLAPAPTGRYVAAISGAVRRPFPDAGPMIQPGETRVWDMATGREVLALGGDRDLKLSVAVSPDGRWVAAASYNHAAVVWDAATGAKLLTLRGHTDLIRKVTFSADGTRLATASDDKTLKVWDAATGKELLTLRGHRGLPTDLAFSPDGTLLASGCGLCLYTEAGQPLGSSSRFAVRWQESADTKLWDAGSGQLLQPHVSRSSDGHWVGAGGERLLSGGGAFDSQALQALRLLAPGVHHTAFSLSTSRDGRRKACLVSESTGCPDWKGLISYGARWYPVRTMCLRPRGDAAQRPSALALSPDGERYAWANEEGDVQVHDLANEKKVVELRGHHDGVHSAAWFPDGKRLATVSHDATVRVWDTASGSELLVLHANPEAAHSIAWTPDGQRFASASWDQTVRVWDAATGRQTLVLRGHQGLIHDVAWSDDGQRIVSAAEDNTARVWDATSGQPIRSFPVTVDPGGGVAWSRGCRRLATTGWRGHVSVWDCATGEEVLSLEASGDPSGPSVVGWDREGRLLAFGAYCGLRYVYQGDRDVTIWDGATGSRRSSTGRPPDGPKGPFAWGPDGRHLATGGTRGLELVDGWGTTAQTLNWWDGWNVKSGARRSTALVGLGIMTTLAFSPDGKRTLTGHTDNTVRVWNTATGHELLSLTGFSDGVLAVAFSGDGNRIAAGCRDGTVKVFDGTPLPERFLQKGATAPK